MLIVVVSNAGTKERKQRNRKKTTRIIKGCWQNRGLEITGSKWEDMFGTQQVESNKLQK
jgi:hypothetical protein